MERYIYESGTFITGNQLDNLSKLIELHWK